MTGIGIIPTPFSAKYQYSFWFRKTYNKLEGSTQGRTALWVKRLRTVCTLNAGHKPLYFMLNVFV